MIYKGINPDTGKCMYQFDWYPGYHVDSNDLYTSIKENDVLIPCRKCIGCRLDYSRTWADRLVLELDHTGKALFLTLTYDDDHLKYGDPIDDGIIDPDTGSILVEPTAFGTLCKRDVQLFNKRLREYFKGNEIRFFAAGEYGDKTLRPHVHGIYFGLERSNFSDIKLHGFSKTNQPLYTSDILNRIWKHGFVTIQNVCWQSCAYVARYSLKKLAHGKDNPCYARGVEPEFALMSRNPGIGGHFVKDHPEIFDNPQDKIYISDAFSMNPHTSVNMPSYIFDKLELVNSELYATIKEERTKASNDRFLMELSNTDLDEFEYQKVKEFQHEDRASALRRPL